MSTGLRIKGIKLFFSLNLKTFGNIDEVGIFTYIYYSFVRVRISSISPMLKFKFVLIYKKP